MHIMILALIAPLVLALPHGVAFASNFDPPSGFSYLELQGAVSRTRTTAPNTSSHAPGQRVAFVGSFEFQEPWYATAGVAIESTSISTRIAGTSLELDTEQRLLTLGGGHVWRPAQSTAIYLEGHMVRSSLNHDVPEITPSTRGPPMVRTRVAVFRDTGVGAAFGARYALSERTHLEGRLDVRDVYDQTETMLSVIARRDLTDRMAIGLSASIGRLTSDNIDHITKLGLVLRRSWS